VDDWHAAARHGLAALHFRQLALAPLTAHQAGPDAAHVVAGPGERCCLWRA